MKTDQNKRETLIETPAADEAVRCDNNSWSYDNTMDSIIHIIRDPFY